jgi:hypothetical protein
MNTLDVFVEKGVSARASTYFGRLTFYLFLHHEPRRKEITYAVVSFGLAKQRLDAGNV